jgi:hypothetical protein
MDDDRQLDLALDAHLRRTGSAAARLLVEIADLEDTPAFVHPGMCLTSLPIRSLKDPAAMWRVQNGEVARLTVKPERDDDCVYHGVPSGSKARLILLYLIDRATKGRSPRVELGRSLNDWLARMGAANGGKDYSEVRRQLRRLRHSRISLQLRTGDSRLTTDRAVIASDVSRLAAGTIANDDDEMLIIELSRDFFEEAIKFPVEVQEAAIRQLGEHCRALDIYLWLAFRLPHIDQEVRLSWKALHAQFGQGVRNIRHFRKDFRGDFERALQVYPGARALLVEDGAQLLPSPKPCRMAVLR